MKKLSLLVVLALIAGTACWPFDDDALAEMSLRRERGDVSVLRGTESITVEDDFQLEPGDVVTTAKDSAAELRLKGSRTIELADRSRVEILTETSIEGQGGALLAFATDSTSVSFGDVRATASGSIFRVDQGFGSTRAAAYKGSVELSAPGERALFVEPLWEAQVAAGDIPAVSDPYRLDVTDPWDLEYLPSYVRLEENLDQLIRGQMAELRGQRPTLAFFRALAGRRDVDFMRPYLKGTPAVDLLLAFHIALVSDQQLEEAFERALDLADDGASWAIVAAILSVSPQPLIAQLEDLLLDAGAVAQGPGVGLDLTVAAASDDDSSQGIAPPPGEDPPDDDPPDDDRPDPRPKPTEEPDDCSGTIDCAVKDLTDPDPSPSPTDLKNLSN